MKLNNECVRDLLLYIEENVGLNEYLSIRKSKIKNYSHEELIYTSKKLHEAGYINAEIEDYLDGGHEIYIYSLTWNGHKFLDNVRDNKVWKTTKGIVSKFSSVSLGIIENVAAQVITNIITQQMGLPQNGQPPQ